MGSFKEFASRQKEGFLKGAYLSDFNREEAEIENILKSRKARRRELFLKKIPLLFLHRDEILHNPDYANIKVDFVFDKPYGFPSGIPCEISLSDLLLLWDSEKFKSICDCGGVAVLTSFAGSPLTGSYTAHCSCSRCGFAFTVGRHQDTHKLNAPVRWVELLKMLSNAARVSAEKKASPVQIEALLEELEIKSSVDCA